MSSKLTVLDSSVLINAAVGPNPARRMRALSIIADPNPEFAATRFLKLEVLSTPTRYRKRKELSLYQRFFGAVTKWVDEEPLIQPALDLACKYGLGAMDALHLVVAINLNAEFISAERPTKPLYQDYQNISSIY